MTLRPGKRIRSPRTSHRPSHPSPDPRTSRPSGWTDTATQAPRGRAHPERFAPERRSPAGSSAPSRPAVVQRRRAREDPRGTKAHRRGQGGGGTHRARRGGCRQARSVANQAADQGGKKKERHAHFVDGADAIFGDEIHPERPGTPPLSEPPVPSPRKTPTRKAQVHVRSVPSRGARCRSSTSYARRSWRRARATLEPPRERLNSPRISPERSTRWRSPR